MNENNESSDSIKSSKRQEIELFDTETIQEVENIRQDFLQINRQAKKLLSSMGIKYKDLKNYVHDSRNFTSNEWQFLKGFRKEAKEFKAEMLRALGFDVEKKAKEVKKAVERQKRARKLAEKKKTTLKKKLASRKKQDSASSKRRKRTLGMKKRWMQM
jgi:hypothetical protein